MCFSSYNSCELKVKLGWVGPGERKKSAFLKRLFYLSVEWLNKLSECIYFYISNFKKMLLQTLLLLVFKIVEILQCILHENKGGKLHD